MLEFILVMAAVAVIAPGMISLFCASAAAAVVIGLFIGYDGYTAFAYFLMLWISVNFLGTVTCLLRL